MKSHALAHLSINIAEFHQVTLILDTRSNKPVAVISALVAQTTVEELGKPMNQTPFAHMQWLEIASMIRKYHNHKPQTTPWHREEEPLNHHETPGRQIKQSNQLSLPHKDERNTRMDIK